MPNPLKRLGQDLGIRLLLASMSNGKMPLFPGYSDSKKKSRLYEELEAKTLARAKENMDTWRNALRSAESRENPNRLNLARVYQEIQTDAHLTAVMNNRKEATLQQRFRITDEEGVEDPKATLLIDTPWFQDFICYVLDSRFEGVTLISLGELNKVGRLEEVYKIPMQYFEPVLGVYYPDGTIGNSKPYRGTDLEYTTIEVGTPYDLGLLNKAVPHALWKRTATRFWAEFCQLYGMPVAVAKTAAYDNNRKTALDNMLTEMRAAFHIVMDKEEELNFVESGKGDGSPVYDKLVERCNSELSKLILGQTMTTDDGSSKSQATVHAGIMDMLVRADQRLAENIVNYELLPRLRKLGYAIPDTHRFRFIMQDTLTAEEFTQMAGKFPVDPQYISQRWGIDLLELPENPGRFSQLGVGGVQAQVSVLTAYNMGQMSEEQATAMLQDTFGVSDDVLKQMLVKAEAPPTPPEPAPAPAEPTPPKPKPNARRNAPNFPKG